MNKGLKPMHNAVENFAWFAKRNTDLMNKGLKQNGKSCPHSWMVE